ncbi:acyl-CoA dehydrogenase family protein [Novosphingobium resinovorum]|uniref:acyl-CoA dehydrogenase family protein n=1 Tax=Novosphingobium resinovorum TaxID=158500 RepID=UPI002ECFD4E0|nr:acyl-CoA dehydrogenase family protein [Novosphingobium resinovorum]
MTITPPRLASEAEAIAAAHAAAAQIAVLARDASLNDRVPHEAAEILSVSGVTSIYVPREFGGLGASIETVVETVRIISAADGGVGQILQIHNVMIRGVFSRPDDSFRARLVADIFGGKRFGNALAEGKGKGKGGGTRLTLDDQGIWRLNGRKTFATGGYLAEWISISARATASAKAPGSSSTWRPTRPRAPTWRPAMPTSWPNWWRTGIATRRRRASRCPTRRRRRRPSPDPGHRVRRAQSLAYPMEAVARHRALPGARLTEPPAGFSGHASGCDPRTPDRRELR